MFKATHLAFSDDSNQKRYHSLALCTFEAKNEELLCSELKELLKISDVSEFKWEKLRSAKYRFAAERMVNFVFNHLDKLRVDTIIWDYEDSRHKVNQRDDNENTARMYYHLVSTTTSRRWPISNSRWIWKPDEQSSVDWEILWDCLQLKKHKRFEDLFKENPDFEKVILNKPLPTPSSDHCFIQIADLFAGMGTFSTECFDRYKLWLGKFESKNQLNLFGQENVSISFSDLEEERFKIIKLVRDKCGERSLKVGLDNSGGLKSHSPISHINFWRYIPQSASDKAPTKGR